METTSVIDEQTTITRDHRWARIRMSRLPGPRADPGGGVATSVRRRAEVEAQTLYR